MNWDVWVAGPLRDAARSLARSRGFTVTAVLSVGGAIGLACSLFAVIMAAFFVAPPFKDPERLVQFWQTASPASSQPQDYLTPVRMEAWVGHQEFRTLQGVAATGLGPTLILRGDDGAEKVSTAPVLGDWFKTMGVEAERGRVLSEDDLRSGASPAAVVSDSYWRSRMGGGALGSLVLSGVGYTVVGVMPPAFASSETVWVPVESLPAALRPAAYAGVGRLRAGFSPGDAATEVQHLAAVQVQEDSARYAGLGATVKQFGAQARGANRPALWMLAGVVLAVLLLALNNLTVLMLVRAQARHTALAVRAALGASRWELGRGLAAEGVLIGLSGATIGLVLAVWGKDAAAALPGVDLSFEPPLGLGAVGVAVGLAVLAATVIGVEPARRLGSLNLQELLQRRAAGSGGTRGERRARDVLVAVQVAMCVILLPIAGVLAEAYHAYGGLDVGFDARRVVEAFPDWTVADLAATQQWQVADRVTQRLARFPGVEATSAWRQIGEDYPPRPEFDAVTDGRGVSSRVQDRLYRYYEVRPGFFATLGVKLVRGRLFTPADERGITPVAVVTEHAARAWWPDTDPLGHQIKLGASGTWMTVVGVVKDIHQLNELGRAIAIRSAPPLPLVFVPAGQFSSPPVGWRPFSCCSGVRIGIRPAGSIAVGVQAAQSVLAQEAPDLPMVRIGSIYDAQMRSFVGQSIASAGKLVAAALIVALVLALVGIIGVVNETVHRRTHEVGVRMALGARARHISWVIARASVYTTCAGVCTGLVILAVLRAWLSKTIFGFEVQYLAPGVLSLSVLAPAATVVLVTTLLAVIIASRRAFRVDVVDALRSD